MNIEKYLDDTIEVIERSFVDIDRIYLEKEQAQKKLKDDINRLEKKVYENEYGNINKIFDESFKTIVNNSKLKVDVIRNNYQNELKEIYMLSGAKINKDDQALLQSNIKISKEEFTIMVDRNKNNVTMLRMLKAYAVAKGLQLSYVEQERFNLVEIGYNKETTIFDNFISLLIAGYSNNASIRYSVLAGIDEYKQNALKRLEDFHNKLFGSDEN